MSSREKQIKASIDSKWFLKLRDIVPPLLISSFKIEGGMYQYQYNKFIGDRVNPDLKFITPDMEVINEKRSRLILLRHEIIQFETNKAIAEQYVKKIDYYVMDIDLIIASIDKDWSSFEKINELRFGNLDTDDLRSLVNSVKDNYGVFSNFELSYKRTDLGVSKFDLANLGSQLKIDDLGDIDFKKIYQAEEICEIWNTQLKKIYPNWKCKISSLSFNIRTYYRKSEIIIPKSIRLKGRRVISLYMHEVMVHVHRREMGKASKLQLLSIGLADYSLAEEGLALMHEQVVLNRKMFFGADRYIALGLALGDIDGIKRDFSQTFDSLQQYLYARYCLRFDAEKALNLSSKSAWRLCVKIFKGGNPSIPGCCLRKEKLYREGNKAMWNLFLNKSDIFGLWQYGKFNLLDEEQVLLVKTFY